MNFDLMEALKQCRKCGRYSERMDKCLTCKEKYGLKWYLYVCCVCDNIFLFLAFWSAILTIRWMTYIACKDTQLDCVSSTGAQIFGKHVKNCFRNSISLQKSIVLFGEGSPLHFWQVLLLQSLSNFGLALPQNKSHHSQHDSTWCEWGYPTNTQGCLRRL